MLFLLILAILCEYEQIRPSIQFCSLCVLFCSPTLIGFHNQEHNSVLTRQRSQMQRADLKWTWWKYLFLWSVEYLGTNWALPISCYKLMCLWARLYSTSLEKFLCYREINQSRGSCVMHSALTSEFCHQKGVDRLWLVLKKCFWYAADMGRHSGFQHSTYCLAYSRKAKFLFFHRKDLPHFFYSGLKFAMIDPFLDIKPCKKLGNWLGSNFPKELTKENCWKIADSATRMWKLPWMVWETVTVVKIF